MKTKLLLAPLTSILAVSPSSAQDESLFCRCHEVSGAAPAGVMNDHVHPAGGGMIGYRYEYQRFDGLQRGTSDIGDNRVLHAMTPHGDMYMATPRSMDMHMHMIEFMWAPTDRITLMAMPMYMEMNMEMYGGAGHGHTHTPTMKKPRTFTHSSAGWGDTDVNASFLVWSYGAHSLILNAGLSLPTGSVDEKMHSRYTHYMMQQGSGTWDLEPSVVYTGFYDRYSWGAKIGGVMRTGPVNDSGYKLGNAFETTAWSAVEITKWCSASLRGIWRDEDDIKGHYNGPHNHTSPPDFQENYGGQTFDLGVGLNFMVPSGALAGSRFSVEALFPVYQRVNGIQLQRDMSLIAGLSWAF